MLAKVKSCALLGIEGIPLEVEVDLAGGLPCIDLIGLPDPSVREARERVRAAVRNSGFEFPMCRITVNLAPADIKKEGPGFDLAIAVGLLAATGQIRRSDVLSKAVLVGELSLEGSLRPIPGTLAMAASIARNPRLEGTTFFVPHANRVEASLIEQVAVRGVRTLAELADFFNGTANIPVEKPQLEKFLESDRPDMDFNEVKGQESAKRALEIAAAGNHNILLYGPPGSGKTMLARRLTTILPAPSVEEMLEITRIHSVAGQLSPQKPLLTVRPFRSPHHSASAAGIIGGGKVPRPGEVSLAHRGVLFFDELPEYNREVLEALRQPLEEGQVTVTRVAATVTYPADFIFVGSMNPCPCGNFGDPARECRCSPQAVQRYRAKISGPLLDRIDLQVEMPRVEYRQLEESARGEESAAIRSRVEEARRRQEHRFRHLKILTNGEMSARQAAKFCVLGPEGRELLRRAFQNLKLSMRAHDRILKVARTIADLDGQENIQAEHVAEAIQYRGLDRQIEF